MKATELIKELQAAGNPEKAEHSKRFFKTGLGEYGEGDYFYGITVPEQRKIARKFQKIPLNEIEILLQHPIHEVRLVALFILVDKAGKEGEEMLNAVVKVYLRNLDYVNNWDLVDSSAPFILGPFLEQRDRSILTEFALSDNLWKRRVAILSCFYFIRKNEFEDALSISEILMNDKHNLIHKAVGWMLREIGNRNFNAEKDFLNKHYQNMPRTMLRYAIEKFDEPIRLRYLKGEV